MKITKIQLKNFRNIENLELTLNENINLFVGDNAQGKTNFLESICTLALSKSHRNINEFEIIKENKDFFKVVGWLDNNNKYEIICTEKEKNLKINDIKVDKVSNYISNINIIMFTPDDLEIIKKSPQYRRNLLNTELCQLYRNYVILLNEYNKILKIRNDYLKNNYGKYDYNYLNIITEKLIERLIKITKYRVDYINDVNLKIGKIFKKITNKDNLHIIYEPSVPYIGKSLEEIMSFYKQNYEKDIMNRMTMYGSHRDDFSFYLDDKNLKLYGSQGQQRIAILSFKLAEIDIFKKIKKEYPIVLLDDVFSEIDIKKRNNIIKFIKSNIQYIITTTDLKNINQKIVDNAGIFKVKDGNITKKEGRKNG